MRALLTIFLLSGLINCTQSEENDTEALRLVVNGIIEADNNSDLESVLSFYDNDATLMPPGRPSINGIEAIKNNYEQIFSTSVLNLKIDIDEIKLNDNWGICVGQTTGFSMAKVDSTIKEVHDNFVMVLKKQGSTWKIERLIWN